MILRFASEDADQLVIAAAAARHAARFSLEDALAALTPQLEELAPRAANELRVRVNRILGDLNRAFDLAVKLEKVAVQALRDGAAPPEADDEEEALEEAPELPRPKLSPGCQSLRRQFFAAAGKRGLITKQTVRAPRLAAISNFLGRTITTTSELSEAEWTSLVYAVEDGRLEW